MKAVVWSRRNCPFCEQAKSLLELKKIPFEVRMIDGESWTREQLLEVAPTARTVPQIFLDEQLIGGFTELKTYLSKEQL